MDKNEIDCLACPINMVCDNTITFGSIYCQQAREVLKTDAQQLQDQIRTAIKEMECHHHTTNFGTGYNTFIKKMRELAVVWNKPTPQGNNIKGGLKLSSQIV